MKYSFVLPAYKSTYLREAIDSILMQTYNEFELIIVNDASPEDLKSIVASYNDKRIRYYVNDVNVGGKDLVAQWNYCASYAKGEYLILASDDDVYFPQYLEKMNVLVDKFPDVDVFRPRINKINHNGDIIAEDVEYKERMTQIEFSALKFQWKISGGISMYLFRRKALDKIGGFVNFPIAWFSDDATVIKLSKNDIIISNDILFSFRNSGINITSCKSDIQTLCKKISATESFYKWLITEVDQMICYNESDTANVRMIRNTSSFRRNDHIIYCIKNSSCSHNLMQCWKVLSKLKILKYTDRIKIFCRSCFSK